MLLCCGRGTAFAHAPLRLAADYGHAALLWTKDGLCPRSFHRLPFDPRPRQRKRNPQPFSVPSAALPADFIAGDSSRASPPPFFSKFRLRTPCSCSFSPPPAPQARAAAPAPPPPRCTQLELAAIPGVPRRKGVLGKPSGACLLCRDTCSPLAKCCPYLALCSLPPPPVSATAILTWVAVGVVRPRVSPGVAKAGLLPSQLGSRTGPCSQRAGLCLLACRRAAWSLGIRIRIRIRELRIDPIPVYSANDLWSAPSTILVDIVWSSSAFLDRNRKNNPSEDDSEPSAPVTSPARNGDLPFAGLLELFMLPKCKGSRASSLSL
ncbi:hypothetical protein U9M48_027853 [Paspalum notatum var. saurae]|uniref:Uncharacterized protein n=1 Tax=Paspalum notatum var. saurae TaxID=547442 RepID=A0AAQ3TVJ6_PASNO